MSKKLTVKSALQECVKIWTKLAKNGDEYKPQSAYDKFEHGCPCCEYVCQQLESEREDGMSCGSEEGVDPKNPALKLCPLKKLWPRGCCDTESPFALWNWSVRCDDAYRRTYAQEIVDGCKKELKRIASKAR